MINSIVHCTSTTFNVMKSKLIFFGFCLVVIVITLCLFSSCRQKYYCHTVDEFFNTNPVDVKKYLMVSIKKVECDVFRIDLVEYNRKESTIYMDFYHQTIQKQ